MQGRKWKVFPFLFAFLLTILTSYIAYAMKLIPESRFSDEMGTSEADRGFNQQVREALWVTNLREQKEIRDKLTPEQISDLAHRLSLLSPERFTVEEIEEILNAYPLDEARRKRWAGLIHSMLGFIPRQEPLSSAPLSLSRIPRDLLKGKIVFVRVDVNVKYKNGKAREDDRKIVELFHTVDTLIEKGMFAVLATHKGRPEGYEAKESLRPVYEVLANRYGKDRIGFLDAKELGREALSTRRAVEMIKERGYQIVLLDNLRFLPEEKKGEESFARSLVEGVDMYIFDGPAVAHRPKDASLKASQFAPLSVIGPVAQKEREVMSRYLDSDLTFYGGAKNVDKIKRNKDGSINFAKSEGKMFALYGDLLTAEQIKDKKIFIGGTMLNAFLAAKGLELGNSRGCSEQEIEVAKAILRKIEELGLEERVILPSNLSIARVSTNAEGKEEYRDIHYSFDISESNPVPEGYVVLDIGEKAIEQAKALIAKAKKIDWNGSMGKTDVVEFQRGTDELLRFISKRADKGEIKALIAGGDSAIDAQRVGVSSRVELITGGGAYLSFKANQGRMEVYDRLLTQYKARASEEEIRRFAQAKLSPEEIDLQKVSGLPIKLRKRDWRILFAGKEINPTVRLLKPDDRRGDSIGLIEVLKDPEVFQKPYQFPPNPVIYYMYRGAFSSSEDRKTAEEKELRYDITVIPPGVLGEEFVKTAGHFHRSFYPEVYAVLYGEAYYLLQKRDGSDFIVVHAREGDKVVIPPEYGHITVNPNSEKPLVMANWVSTRVKSEYEQMQEKQGAMYYLTKDEKGGVRFVPNPHYSTHPPIRVFTPEQTIAFGLSKDKPIYGLIKTPEKLDFLNRPYEYETEFAQALREVEEEEVQPLIETDLAKMLGKEQLARLRSSDKTLYVDFYVLFDEKGRVRVVGLERFLSNLNNTLGKRERFSEPLKIVIPSQEGRRVAKAVAYLTKISEQMENIALTTSEKARQEIEEKKREEGWQKSIVAVIAKEEGVRERWWTGERWWAGIPTDRLIKVESPSPDEISFALLSIVSGLDLLADERISPQRLYAWLTRHYEGKIEREEIENLFSEATKTQTFLAVKPTILDFLERYQDILKAQQVLIQQV